MQTYNETIIMKYWMNSERLDILQTYTEQSRAHILFSAKLYLITFSTKEMLWYNMHCPTRLRYINISFLLRLGLEVELSWRNWVTRGRPWGFSGQPYILPIFCFQTVQMTHWLTAVILSSSQRWSILSQTVSQNKPLLL